MSRYYLKKSVHFFSATCVGLCTLQERHSISFVGEAFYVVMNFVRLGRLVGSTVRNCSGGRVIIGRHVSARGGGRCPASRTPRADRPPPASPSVSDAPTERSALRLRPRSSSDSTYGNSARGHRYYFTQLLLYSKQRKVYRPL